jgi:hypothetical protein
LKSLTPCEVPGGRPVASGKLTRLAETTGIDLVKLRDALMMSSGNSDALKDWDMISFTWALKDMQIVAKMADKAGLPPLKYDAKADTITRALAKYGVTMTRTYNGNALGNVSPRYTWTWDADQVKITGPEIMRKLGETKTVAIGSPPGLGMGAGGMSGRSDPNWSGPNDSAGGGGAPRPAGAAGGGRGGRGGGAPNSFGFSTWLLKDGEDRYIANRLVEIFQEAGGKGNGFTAGSHFNFKRKIVSINAE